jgi:hypothetical protein
MAEVAKRSLVDGAEVLGNQYARSVLDIVEVRQWTTQFAPR